MKLVILIGPPAVGKMTVGKALEAITGLRLFYNHMSIELVHKFFEFGTPAFERLDKLIRFAIFEEVAQSELPGIIFTMLWDYDFPEDEQYVDEIIQIFSQQNAQICLVELNAHLEERLKRNKHPERLAAKPTKRDLEWSEKSLLQMEKEYRMQSQQDEFSEKEILKIDNTHLEPQEVARIIKAHYQL